MYRKLASIIMVVAAISSQHVFALGLGGMTMHSALNQELEAEIALSNTGDFDASQILVVLASREEFQKAGVERALFLSDIKFKVILDGKGKGVVKLTSTRRLNEPYLDFLIEAKWPTGRVLRSYTALVDLPVYAEEKAMAITAPSTVAAPALVSANSSEDSFSSTRQSIQSLRENKTTATNAAASRSSYVPRSVSTVYTGGDYTVQQNETLSQIARKLKPNSNATINQTMIAIQRLNPNAFVRNNINLIKARAVLRVPTAADIGRISISEANRDVSNQSQQWRGAQLDATDASVNPMKRPTSIESEGHLSLTSAGSGLANGKAKSEAGTQALNATKEGLAASKLENKELNGRVESLGEQVNKLKRMIELKDAELAELQAKLGKQPTTSTKPVINTVVDKKAIEEPKAEKLAKTETTPIVAEKKPTVKAESKKAETKPQIAKPQKPKKEPELSFFEQVKAKPIYIGAVALILIFGVVAFLFRRKAQADRQSLEDNDISNFDFDEVAGNAADFDELASVDEEFDSEADEYESIDADDGNEEFDVEAEESTVMQTSDPIGEADIYIAYGRFDQATDLLLNAIAAAPKNIDLRTKLLEVYVESKNKAGFQQQYVEMRTLGNSAALNHAKELLSSTDGVADWLDDLPAEELSSDLLDLESDLDSLDTDFVEDVQGNDFEDLESSASVREEFTEDLDLSDMDAALDNDDFGFDVAESVVEPSGAEEDVSDFDADLSLDLSDMELDNEAMDLSSELDTEVDLSTDDLLSDDDLAFDLSDEIESMPAESVADLNEELSDVSSDFDDFNLDESAFADIKESASEEDDLSFEEFDLDLNESSEEVAAEVEDSSLLDFSDIDLGLDVSSAAAEPTILRDAIDLSFEEEIEIPEIEESLDADFDLDISTDVEEPSIIENSKTESVVDEPHVSAPLAALESEDLEFLTDGDEVATKLDLAQAYVDLGDIDGARDILLEVMKEGREEQKAEAAALLDSLD
jgi:pilus assembly protein FimV